MLCDVIGNDNILLDHVAETILPTQVDDGIRKTEAAPVQAWRRYRSGIEYVVHGGIPGNGNDQRALARRGITVQTRAVRHWLVESVPDGHTVSVEQEFTRYRI